MEGLEENRAVIPKAGRRARPAAESSMTANPAQNTNHDDAPPAGGRGFEEAASSANPPSGNNQSNQNTNSQTGSSKVEFEDTEKRENSVAKHGRRVEAASKPASKKKDDSDDDGNIPEIPDIEELNGSDPEDIKKVVANAPKVRANIKITTLDELEKDVPFAIRGEGGARMGLLTGGLMKQEDIKEEDKEWSYEILFGEVSSYLNTLAEKQESLTSQIVAK